MESDANHIVLRNVNSIDFSKEYSVLTYFLSKYY